MIVNVVLAMLAARLVIEAKTDGGRVVGGAILSACTAAVLRSAEAKTVTKLLIHQDLTKREKTIQCLLY